MEKRFYLDTNIWRDYYENRSDSLKSLGKPALNFLLGAIKEGNLIIYSELVVHELISKYTKEEISAIFSIFYNLNILVKAEISKNQAKEASDLCRKRNVPFGDALHAILARDNGAMLITRDNHFKKLNGIAETKKPEELI
ncbi:MAG: PIN domain-containing protein [Nanoarchaeota archaeon]